MDKRMIGVQLADLTKEREERLRRAVSDKGFEMKVLQKGSGYDPMELSDCEILFGNFPPSELKLAKELRWHATASAGIDQYVDESIYDHEGILLTNSSGAYGVAIAEHMLTVALMLLRRMRGYEEGQRRKEWKYLGKIGSIYGSTVTAVGIGDIGSNFAKRCQALGARAIGVKRSPSEKPDYLDELYLTGDMDRAVKDADIVALSLPGTDETKHVFGRKEFAAMKEGAIFINVGRGRTIDQDALIEALQSGKLGGAALDVTEPEPLPSDCPLWEMENVIITPHISGNDSLDHTTEMIIDMFIEDLERYRKGEELKNTASRKRGY